MIADALTALAEHGLTTGSAARLLAVNDRNLRRWKADPDDSPPDVREILSILSAHPEAIELLRTEYAVDHPDAGPTDVRETVRRLRWLRSRYPD